MITNICTSNCTILYERTFKHWLHHKNHSLSQPQTLNLFLLDTSRLRCSDDSISNTMERTLHQRGNYIIRHEINIWVRQIHTKVKRISWRQQWRIVMFSLWIPQKFASFSHLREVNTLLRRPFKPANFFSTADRTACKHAFCFLRVLPEAVSTRHSWLWQTLDDMYTRRCFSESEGTRFGAPGQKALPSGNEFTLLWIFA